MPMSKEDILEVYETRKEESEYSFSIDLKIGKLEIFADWSSEEVALDYDFFINKTDFYDGGRFIREAFEMAEDYQFEFLVFDILEGYFKDESIFYNKHINQGG